MSEQTPQAHPAAAAWPMLPEPDLRRLADDISENGLRDPIVLDTDGLVLDGRNRLAACQIAGVKPEYRTYEGDDPVAYVISTNERRHQTVPERAASVALTLATNGKREDGKWAYGAVSGTAPNEGDPPRSTTWKAHMRDTGLVLDYLGEARLKRVAAGLEALDAAVKHAKKAKAEQARVKDLPDDLRTLVEAGELEVVDAERRAALSDRYAKMVAAGDLSLDEAEHLNDRDEREYRESIERAKSAIEGFIYGWDVAVNLSNTSSRDDVLHALSDHDRERFLAIQKELP